MPQGHRLCSTRHGGDLAVRMLHRVQRLVQAFQEGAYLKPGAPEIFSQCKGCQCMLLL